ncbi:MAG: IS66 family transposase [Methylococcales bacterium]
MSDGYAVSRRFKNRLRCWAHPVRKATFLTTGPDPRAQQFGEAGLELLERLMEAVYQAREGPPVDLTPNYAGQLDAFQRLCEQHRDAARKPTRALAREFLLDREAIFQVLAYPHLPLTNHEAERALRHGRRSFGASPKEPDPHTGSRALALLAGILSTCRKRNLLPWPYLAKVIAERRKGQPAPPIPAPLSAV